MEAKPIEAGCFPSNELRPVPEVNESGPPQKLSRTKPLIPAAGYHWLTRYYDTGVHWIMRETAFKKQLVGQLGLQSDHKLLDLGCGTGTLLAMLAGQCPDAHFIGIDGDPKVLALAKTKTEHFGAKIDLRQALATSLPFADGVFDRVVTTLVFHHLRREEKAAALGEALRVLKPGGQFFLADLEVPQNALMYLAFFVVRFYDGFETTRDNGNGQLPVLAKQAGFAHWTRTARFATPVGTLGIFQAVKPVGP
jgi:SAM-dependent methyltransferase